MEAQIERKRAQIEEILEVQRNQQAMIATLWETAASNRDRFLSFFKSTAPSI
jgi:hypothetical protein